MCIISYYFLTLISDIPMCVTTTHMCVENKWYIFTLGVSIWSNSHQELCERKANVKLQLKFFHFEIMGYIYKQHP